MPINVYKEEEYKKELIKNRVFKYSKMLIEEEITKITFNNRKLSEPIMSMKKITIGEKRNDLQNKRK